MVEVDGDLEMNAGRSISLGMPLQKVLKLR